MLFRSLSTYRRYEAIGKGTMVIPVRATGNAAAKFGNGLFVAKRTWSMRSSPSEAHALKVILTALKAWAPRYLKHVADLKCYVEQTATEHDLPRILMPGLMDKERCYRLLISTRYEPLQKLRSAAEFRKVFVDTVRGTYHTQSLNLISDLSIQLISGWQKLRTICMVTSAATT